MGIKTVEIVTEEDEEVKTSEPSLKEIATDSSQAMETLNHVLNDSISHWNNQIRELQEKTGDLIATLKLLIKLSSESANQDIARERIDASANDLLLDHLFAQVLKGQNQMPQLEGENKEKIKTETEADFKRMLQLITKKIN